MARPRKQYRICKHRYISKKTGKAKESLKWNVYFRDYLQIERKLTGSSDKSTTEYIAKNVVAIVNCKATNQPLPADLRTFMESQPRKLREQLTGWGILNANTNAGFEPLATYTKIKVKHSKLMKYDVTGGHIYHWMKSMEANERTTSYISESVAKVIRIVRGCKFITPSDINGETFKNWMANKRNRGKGINAINGHLTSFKSFTRWMLRTDRISQNPIQYLRPLRKLDRERPRRALTIDEIIDLITATIKAEKHHGLTGYERSLIYHLALSTGLRYNEIYTLMRGDVVTAGNKPCLTIQAGNAKNRKCDTLPLKPELAKDLTAYFSNNLALPHTKAFSGMWKDAGAKMLRPDLELAGIKYQTDDGVADFHSLRHTFGTLLAKSNVMPQVAQKLMRHSDINLTMGIYTHLLHSDKANALAKLPKIESKKQVKTGTADVSENLTANLTGNPIKIAQNTAKYSKVKVCKAEDVETVTPCNANSLQKVTAIRPAGLEPATYGLEIRCSIQLSYGRNKSKLAIQTANLH